MEREFQLKTNFLLARVLATSHSLRYQSKLRKSKTGDRGHRTVWPMGL